MQERSTKKNRSRPVLATRTSDVFPACLKSKHERRHRVMRMRRGCGRRASANELWHADNTRVVSAVREGKLGLCCLGARRLPATARQLGPTRTSRSRYEAMIGAGVYSSFSKPCGFPGQQRNKKEIINTRRKKNSYERQSHASTNAGSAKGNTG